MNSASLNCDDDVINTWLLLTQRAILESSTAAAAATTTGATISSHLVRFFARLFFQSDAWFLLNNLRLNDERSSTDLSCSRSSSSSSSLSSKLPNERRCTRRRDNNEKPYDDNVCFLSQRSPLRGIADRAFDARSRTFHLTRDLMQRLVALRLCAFGVNASGEKQFDDTTKQQPKDRFCNFDLLSSTEDDAAATDAATTSDNCNDDCYHDVTDITQRRVSQVLLRLRRDILAERARIGVSEVVAADLARELLRLREDYDALLIEATTRYGEWYEYRYSDDAAKNVVDIRLIDDTMRSTCRRVSSRQLDESSIIDDRDDDERCDESEEEGRDEKSDNGIAQNASRSNRRRRYFVSTQRWNAMTEVDRLFVSAEQLRSLLLHTNDSVQLLVQQQTVELERALTAEGERRRVAFELQRDALLAEKTATSAQLAKLRELAKQTTLIERISSDVRSIINDIRLSLSQESERQRARNQSLVTDYQNANRRTLHIMQILTHEQTGRSKMSAFTREYIGRGVTYPRVVDCSDLRQLRDSICWNNCVKMLQLARPELRRDRELVLRDKIVTNDEHRTPDIRGYMSANEMRDALVACLYFYGDNETFLSTIERLYEYMHRSANRNNDIKDVYASSIVSKLLLDQRRDDDNRVATRLYEGLAILRTEQLDLRSIPRTLFKAIIMIFRYRMDLHNHLVASSRSSFVSMTDEATTAARSIVEPKYQVTWRRDVRS